MKYLIIILLITPLLFWDVSVFAQDSSGSKEIDAINNRCVGTLPGTLCDEVGTQQEVSLWKTISNSLSKLFIRVTGSVDLSTVVPRTEVTQQATVPFSYDTEVPEKVVENSLCDKGDTGVYGVLTPQFNNEADLDVKGCEQKFDQSFFPQNVNVVVP